MKIMSLIPSYRSDWSHLIKLMKPHRIHLLAAGLAGLLSTLPAYSADAPDSKPLPDVPDKKQAVEAAPKPASEIEKGLRLNFRGVSLETVLNYLSDAAGFIIVLETKVDGKVDVWSNQPLNKDEAVNLLNSILN